MDPTRVQRLELLHRFAQHRRADSNAQAIIGASGGVSAVIEQARGARVFADTVDYCEGATVKWNSLVLVPSNVRAVYANECYLEIVIVHLRDEPNEVGQHAT